MSIPIGTSRAQLRSTHKPLAELLQRARRSKHIVGGNESAESEAARVAYARLGKLVGR